jgi:thiamine-phosphate diphosphorylase
MEAQGADYLGVGPVFGTTTKMDAPAAVGLETISLVARAVKIPVIGIGGVNAENAASVLDAGAAGVAVISAVGGAHDPEEATRAIRRALDEAAGFPVI